MEYFRERFFDNLKVIIVSLALGTVIVGIIGWFTYKDMVNGESVLKVLGAYFILLLLVALVICSLINVFNPSNEFVGSVIEGIIGGSKSIIGGIFGGAFTLAVVDSISVGGMILLLIAAIRFIIGIIAMGISMVLFIAVTLVINVVFWLQTIYYFVRYIVALISENKAIPGNHESVDEFSIHSQGEISTQERNVI